jgi:2-amino-4-hydroxy-6-hydroxymethyldihydropteridine diphosphokinase
MILVGLGSNLPGIAGTPAQTLAAAIARLDTPPLRLLAVSRLWRTRPVPDSGQPWYANAVASIETDLQPGDLLAHLHAIEQAFGRERGAANADRTLDLDLLDYDERLMTDPMLPHPRMDGRAFVLRPLADIAPAWRHPVTGKSIPEMLAALPATGQDAEPEAAP